MKVQKIMKSKLFVLLMACCAMSNAVAQSEIAPMVTASWNQSTPFNDECPNGTVAGWELLLWLKY